MISASDNLGAKPRFREDNFLKARLYSSATQQNTKMIKYSMGMGFFLESFG